jgi:hypothetical protein
MSGDLDTGIAEEKNNSSLQIKCPLPSSLNRIFDYPVKIGVPLNEELI